MRAAVAHKCKHVHPFPPSASSPASSDTLYQSIAGGCGQGDCNHREYHLYKVKI